MRSWLAQNPTRVRVVRALLAVVLILPAPSLLTVAAKMFYGPFAGQAFLTSFIAVGLAGILMNALVTALAPGHRADDWLPVPRGVVALAYLIAAGGALYVIGRLVGLGATLSWHDALPSLLACLVGAVMAGQLQRSLR